MKTLHRKLFFFEVSQIEVFNIIILPEECIYKVQYHTSHVGVNSFFSKSLGRMKNIYTLTGITFLSNSRCVENKVKNYVTTFGV